MGRMGRDTEQDRIGQADTSQKIACGKPESGKQEAPRLWGKRTANSSEIVHTVLGSLEAYLHMELVQRSYSDRLTARPAIGAFCHPVTLSGSGKE